VMDVSKEGYADVIRTPDRAAKELRDLVAEQEAWLSGVGKKKKKRKK